MHPDGSVSGPYEAWQVVGLLLTLLAPVCWAVWRGHRTAAVLGTTAGLTAAVCYDWADGDLFIVGAGMIAVASLAITSALAALITAARHNIHRRGHRPITPGRWTR